MKKESEFTQVTILFADVFGFTAMSEKPVFDKNSIET